MTSRDDAERIARDHLAASSFVTADVLFTARTLAEIKESGLAGPVLYAYTQPVDMRKGFDGLSALITGRLQRDPLTGDVYIFVSRNRIRAKVLHWDGTGLCIYAKRLERGRFARLWPDEAGAAPVTLTVSELDLFLDGSTVVGRVPLSPPAVTQFSLASDRAR